MKKRGAFNAYTLFLAAYTVLCGGLLAWQCLSIYRTGNAPANLSESGVYITPVYTWQNVSARLRALATWLYGYPAAVLVGLLWRAALAPQAARLKNQGRMEPLRALKGQKPLRALLFTLAAVLTVLGVLNGGARDVLIKAIHICTECIGLG